MINDSNNHSTARTQLALYQAALLELLDENLKSVEFQQRLANDPAFAPFQKYIRSFEPRMIEVASELTKKWGRRFDDS